MRRGIIALLLLATVATVWAQHSEMNYEWEYTEEELHPYDDAIAEFLAQREAKTIGEMTIGEMRELTARLSVIAQEEDYVRRASETSELMPGFGQILIGQDGKGAAFALGSMTLIAGTLVGTYFALPNGVQFDEVDYINDSFRDIRRAWTDESIASMLPAAGVLIGGGFLHSLLGQIASSSAERDARAQIESGEKIFNPQPFIYPDPYGRLILGARIGL